VALGAVVEIVGPEGCRSVPVDAFFVGPRKTVLERGELVIGFRVPVPGERSGSSFLKRGRRKALTLAVVNAAAYVEASQDLRSVEAVRISLGAVAPTPIRARDAEAALRGREFSGRLISEVGVAACREIAPIDDIRATAECRDHISNQLVKRALTTAWQRATGQAHDEEVY
jgi:carbon-monoxide dehydrogenase medium subunit